MKNDDSNDLPESLKVSPEKRKEGWVKNPPKARPHKAEVKPKKSEAPIEEVVVNPGTKKEEPLEMIALTDNKRGTTTMVPPKKETTSAELVAGYNELVKKWQNLGGDNSFGSVTRFKDRETGMRRFKTLSEAVKIRQETTPLQSTAPTTGSNKEKSDMASKAKKAPKAKKVKAPAADDKRSKIAIEFEARAGTVREKVLDGLHASFKKFIPVKDLLKKVYGSANEENKGALMMSVKGALVSIKKLKLKYKIETKREEGVSFIGLFAA